MLKLPIFTFDVPFRKWDSKWKKKWNQFWHFGKMTKIYIKISNCFLNTHTLRLIWNFGRWVMQSRSFRYWDYFVYSFGLRAQTSNSPKSVIFTHANKYTWIFINIHINACDFDIFCRVIYLSFYCGVSRYSRKNSFWMCL